MSRRGRGDPEASDRPAAPGAAVEQRAAAFRKRFERAKAQLRELAVTHGLIPED